MCVCVCVCVCVCRCVGACVCVCVFVNYIILFIAVEHFKCTHMIYFFNYYINFSKHNIAGYIETKLNRLILNFVNLCHDLNV